MAFPCISTGIYKYAKALAAEVAVRICESVAQRERTRFFKLL
ncbi:MULTISPECIES: hypothetical protein [unclassified Nostoc]